MTGPREPVDTGLGTTRTSGEDTTDLTPLFEMDRSTLCCGGSEELMQREHNIYYAEEHADPTTCCTVD